MKQRINIDIKRASVYESVRKNSAYIGKKSMVDGVDFEQVRLKVEQDEILDEYWKEAEAGLMAAVKHYLHSYSDNADGLEIVLDMPSNWDAALRESVERDSMQYMVSYILWKWICIADKDNELNKLLSAEANNLLGGVSRSMFVRRCNERRKRFHDGWSMDCPCGKEYEV